MGRKNHVRKFVDGVAGGSPGPAALGVGIPGVDAGAEEDSGTSVLTADGGTCEPVLRGTAEVPAFVDIWLDHLQAALERLP